MPSDPTTTPPANNSTVTLTCPHCAASLRTAAGTSVEGPCPTCGTTIKYVSPHRAEPATFVPLPPRRDDPAEPEFERPRPSDPPPRPKKPLTQRSRHWLYLADEFFYSRTGRAISCAALAALLFYGVVLFFKWDKRRRARAADPVPAAAVEVVPVAPPPPAGP
jgi:hypothetical protein